MPIVDISGLSKDETIAKNRIRHRMQVYFSQWLKIPESGTTVTFIDDDTAEDGKRAHVMARIYSRSFRQRSETDLEVMCEDFVEIMEEEADHDFHEVFPIPILTIFGRNKKRPVD